MDYLVAGSSGKMGAAVSRSQSSLANRNRIIDMPCAIRRITDYSDFHSGSYGTG